eukprot:c17189_g1_i2.p1 GENE.c17189_g1_i2~~c17189_g1_i2.p1  ORF type:complete len:450 (+),score=213.07 c17189_g1_i2:22-1350(+)
MGKGFIGITGNQTSTHCVILNSSAEVLADIVGGICNWKGAGKDSAKDIFYDVIDQALNISGLSKEDISVVVACMFCVEKERDKEVVLGWLNPKFSDAQFHIFPHAVAALAAGTNCTLDGVVLVAGTIAMALSYSESGEEIRVGGFMKEPGSSYTIGNECLTSAIKSFDGRGAKTNLLEQILSHLNLETGEDLTEWANSDPSTSSISSLSEICFLCDSKGDEVASKIISDAAKHLVSTTMIVAQKCGWIKGDKNEEREIIVVLDGEIATHKRTISYLVNIFKKNLPQVKCVVPEIDPHLGSAFLALSLVNLSKEREEIEKIVNEANLHLPRLQQAVGDVDEVIEALNFQALVSAAQIRLVIDNQVQFLEARMIELINELNQKHKKQLKSLQSQKIELEKIISDLSIQTTSSIQKLENLNFEELNETQNLLSEILQKASVTKFN